MAGLWCEHFQQYSSAADLLNGVFASVSGAWSISTANPPRAGGASLHLPNAFTGALRRVFGAAKPDGAGFGFRLFLASLPGADVVGDPGDASQMFVLGAFLDASAGVQCWACLGADGSVIGLRGPFTSGAVVLGRSAPCISANAYNQIEMKCVPDPTAGSFEVRVNGVTVFNFAGETQATGLAEVSQFYFASGEIGGEMELDITDLHAWDTVGGNGPSDFVGNVAVLRRELSGDTATADWALSAGSTGYTLLTDKSDATYVEADTVGNKSAFQAGALPAGTTGVIYQQVSFRALKTDAADCSVAPSMVSGADETTVTGQPMTTAETWRWGIFGDDPATAAPWTTAAANASDPAITRTA